MSKKILILSSLFFAACLLQSTVLEYIEIINIRPNLLLVAAISVALIREDLESAFMGLAFGLGMDILIGRALGWYAVCFFLICFFIGVINSKLYKENPLIPAFFIFCSSVVIEILYYAISFFLVGYESFMFVFTHIILPESLYNAVLGFPIFQLVLRIYRKIDKLDYIHTRI